MSDAARSARAAGPAEAANAPAALAVVAAPPADCGASDAVELLVAALTAALARSGARPLRSSVEVQPTQRTVVLEVAGDFDLYHLSEAAAAHGAAVASIARREGGACIAVLFANRRRASR